MQNNYSKLDEIDKKILKILQDNSRISIADIAREINELTENAIRYRLDKLEDDDYIANYTIRLNPKKFGKNIIGIFNLNVLPEHINEALTYLRTIENLTEVYLTTGNYSIIAIGFFEDNNAVTTFIINFLSKVKMVDYDVITVLDRVKHTLFGI